MFLERENTKSLSKTPSFFNHPKHFSNLCITNESNLDLNFGTFTYRVKTIITEMTPYMGLKLYCVYQKQYICNAFKCEYVYIFGVQVIVQR